MAAKNALLVMVQEFQIMSDVLTSVETIPVDKVSTRNCPECGHFVSQVMAEMAAVDFDCPRCGKHKISEFVIYEKETRR